LASGRGVGSRHGRDPIYAICAHPVRQELVHRRLVGSHGEMARRERNRSVRLDHTAVETTNCATPGYICPAKRRNAF
jgi:putative hemolysin